MIKKTVLLSATIFCISLYVQAQSAQPAPQAPVNLQPAPVTAGQAGKSRFQQTVESGKSAPAPVASQAPIQSTTTNTGTTGNGGSTVATQTTSVTSPHTTTSNGTSVGGNVTTTGTGGPANSTGQGGLTTGDSRGSNVQTSVGIGVNVPLNPPAPKPK